jgi:hypothetical protein
MFIAYVNQHGRDVTLNPDDEAELVPETSVFNQLTLLIAQKDYNKF